MEYCVIRTESGMYFNHFFDNFADKLDKYCLFSFGEIDYYLNRAKFMTEESVKKYIVKLVIEDISE